MKTTKQSPLQQPVQLVLGVVNPVEIPSGKSKLDDADFHWRAVNELTKALRQRRGGARVKKWGSAAGSASPTRTVKTAGSKQAVSSLQKNAKQKTLSLPGGTNKSRGYAPPTGADSVKVRRQAGLDICRHLVAALRIQHQQDLQVQQQSERRQSA